MPGSLSIDFAPFVARFGLRARQADEGGLQG
jgi:hypothetical protein